MFLPADNQNDYDLCKTKSNHLGIQLKEYITNVSIYCIIHLFLQLVGLLSHPNELISAEILAFLTVILYTGNREIQVFKGLSGVLKVTFLITIRMALATYWKPGKKSYL